MAKGKSVVAVAESRLEASWMAERSREAIDFDPKPMPLHSQRDVLDYLARHDVDLPEEIMEWCPLKMNVRVPPMMVCLSIPRSRRWG